ncbi:MAG TPA: hypothetical protein VL598_16580 [Trinickia sp.]|uniref:hypothetical protein n=1 Tax=Trinickia sp. TaxID=2571163 RepID=UPI002C999CBC|nr:hypothetical protein [Trinickia sp.]HTI19266.1 hypothetical protein [Trinickia sp.]
MKRALKVIVCTVACTLLPALGSAADFDGSTPLLCATFDAHSCDPGETCERALPSEIGLPQFLRVDVAKKTIQGSSRSTPIQLIDKNATQLLLQGTEMGYAWTIALDSTSGALTATLSNREHVYVLFGACTQK